MSADPAAQSPRLFFGMAVARSLHVALSERATHIAATAGGRIVPAGNLHATLAFVGNVPRSRVAALLAIGAALPRQPIDITLDTVGSFDAARVAWIGTREVPRALAALHGALSCALSDGGFAIEARGYQPHVTLVRRCAPVLRANVPSLEWRVDGVTLYESVSAANGPTYRPLER